jgi:hypothetical protein
MWKASLIQRKDGGLDHDAAEHEADLCEIDFGFIGQRMVLGHAHVGERHGALLLGHAHVASDAGLAHRSVVLFSQAFEDPPRRVAVFLGHEFIGGQQASIVGRDRATEKGGEASPCGPVAATNRAPGAPTAGAHRSAGTDRESTGSPIRH